MIYSNRQIRIHKEVALCPMTICCCTVFTPMSQKQWIISVLKLEKQRVGDVNQIQGTGTDVLGSVVITTQLSKNET